MRSASGEQPEQPGHDKRDADRGGSHVLDPPDLRIMVGGQAIGEFFDRGVEQFDHQHQHDRRDQFDAAHHGGADQPGQRQRQRQRDEFLANSLLRPDRKGEAVTRVDRGPPEPQQVTVPRRPASV